MTITYEEFEKNVDYYLEKVAEEDILIVKDGEAITVLLDPQRNADFIKRRKNLK